MNITITKAASNKIASILSNESSETYMRIFVEGGGCSGFKYSFSLDDSKAHDDWDIIQDAASVLIDGISAQYLEGATVDYVETLQSSSFSITNPNTVSTCGCGSSFTLSDKY